MGAAGPYRGAGCRAPPPTRRWLKVGAAGFTATQIKVPNAPIPVSWGKVIAPYKPKGVDKEPAHAIYAEEKDILSSTLTKYGKDFLAVLLNPPYAGEWSSKGPAAPTKGCTVDALVSWQPLIGRCGYKWRLESTPKGS